MIWNNACQSAELTTKETADMLNILRQTLIMLWGADKMPNLRKDNGHRMGGLAPAGLLSDLKLAEQHQPLNKSEPLE